MTDKSEPTVKLKHPDSKQTIEVNEADADRYLSQGWSKPSK